MMEERDDTGGKVIGLIEKATKSTAQEVDPRMLKAIKSTVRYSDSELRFASQTLMDLMKRDHSQVRYLTLLIIDELFMRSKLFRTLTISNLDQLLSLSVGFRTNQPLPKPPAIATLLRTKAIEFLEKWNSSFGLHYKEIRLGFDYLKNTLKLKFPDLQANAARIQRERQERENRTKELQRKKFDSLKDNFGVLKNEIEETIKEIKECLEIVHSRNDDENAVPLSMLDEEDEFEEIRCSHLRQIRLESLKQADKVEENNENKAVFDVLREQWKLLVTKHLVSVQDAISLLIRVDVNDNRTRDSLLKELIDIRNNITKTRKKCEEAGFTMSKAPEKEDEDEEDIWEEDDGKNIVTVAPSPSPTVESKSYKRPSIKNRGGGDTVRDKLISEAPVVNWGSQLSNWDSTSENRANHRGLEVESHWGRVDQDAVIPADKIAELNLQASIYREERTETTTPCNAPLKKGGLCPRRDLRICPFHGAIIPRDDQGNPINPDSDSDPEMLAREIAKQALKNIRERDKEEEMMLRKKKRAKLVKVKVKEHNQAVLRDAALASTSKSAALDEEFDRVIAAKRNKKVNLRRKRTTTAKDRISERLFSNNNRVKGNKPKPLVGDDEKYRETNANQW